MSKRILISVLAAALLAGCAPPSTPTLSAEDTQGTAVAAAWTVVAMTQQAIPTATPIPPTETPNPTPLPTFTPLPQPTSNFPTQSSFDFPTSVPAGGPTADPCNAPIPAETFGRKTKTTIVNQSGGSVILSLYLFKTPYGECGIYSFNLAPNASISAQLLEGSYWAGAFVTGKRNTKAFGLNITLKPPSDRLVITSEYIRQ